MGARYGERVQSIHALSKGATLPNLHVFTNPEALRTPKPLRGFEELSAKWHD